MRLIDADDLKERFFERYMAALEWRNKTIFKEKANGEIAAYLECVRTLDTECTIDAVPVVRCKECKYFLAEDKGCDLFYAVSEEDDFCSFAKRKENGK